MEEILGQVFENLDNFDKYRDDGYGEDLFGHESMDVD